MDRIEEEKLRILEDLEDDISVDIVPLEESLKVFKCFGDVGHSLTAIIPGI